MALLLFQIVHVCARQCVWRQVMGKVIQNLETGKCLEVDASVLAHSVKGAPSVKDRRVRDCLNK